MGIDPVLEKLPLQGSFTYVVEGFFLTVLDQMEKQSIYPVAVKPNMAFFEAYGVEGLQVLKNIIEAYQKQGCMVILDAKRGDILSTSVAYAKMAFEYFRVDAVTLSPYMGYDVVKPFQEKSESQGIYVLVRTSNPSAGDFQNLNIDGKPLYYKVAEQLLDWNDGNLAAVVGATALDEMKELLKLWKSEIPCLIPGVSIDGVGQGAVFEDVVSVLQQKGKLDPIHLINISSGLSSSFHKYPELHFSEGILKTLKEIVNIFKTMF